MAILVFTRLKDHPRETYVATSGALIVGRIDCINADPTREEWSWGLNLDIGGLPFRRGGVAVDREEAVASLDEAWSDWKTWAGLRDIDTLPP
ncbi:hypothetical protein [Methylobacterium sp. Leaf118]|uniref:hypothetical protein n=1 Tax=Methylobacterium sp. Leaf118 TaxID=2876562 RepID=UPI001E4B75F9|nr:hypothetical protein [Methylobacterium sp. Leaf118]